MNTRWHITPGSTPPRIAFDIDKVAGLSASDDFDTDMSSTRSSSLSDVPEEAPENPKQVSGRSPYSNPPASGTSSTSTFAVPANKTVVAAASTPNLLNASQSATTSHSTQSGTSSHRTPATTSRKASSRSLHRTVTEIAPSTSHPPNASGGSSSGGQSLRRNVSNGSASSLSAITTSGGRSPRIPASLGNAVASSSKVPQRTRSNPRLPHDKDAEPSPSTAMHWSRAPVYGTLPMRSVRSHTVTLVDTTAWLFGGCDDQDSARDIYCFDVETMQWTHPDTTGEAPPPCRAHTCTLVDRKLVIFGGGLGPTYYDFIYILDTITRRWSKPQLAGGANAPRPVPRRAHTAVLYLGMIWIFGGGNGMQALNDLWTLDVNSCTGPSSGSGSGKLRWQELQTKGGKPCPRGYHTANLIGNTMVVAGGSDGSNYFTDIWLLNLDELVWTELKTVDISYRLLAHTSTQVGSYLYIIGGHNGDGYTSQVLLFNLVNLQYETRAIYGKAPSVRGYHATILADSRLFLFGGYNGQTSFDDVYILDLAANAYLPQVTSFTIDAF
ncbi:hypothetical protein AMATHDRAFT_61181 [Amanita thiersii Skay4041]|uniref:Galactose oxidase n=1 Tax=Amanita thiersii Skay4041 TaxID=703135 RepID=A0A2A9NJX9_9AGAR|nr:hypothetical protein AMATHDRAFT_61181 [Amanita thiersii Skay4041]